VYTGAKRRIESTTQREQADTDSITQARSARTSRQRRGFGQEPPRQHRAEGPARRHNEFMKNITSAARAERRRGEALMSHRSLVTGPLVARLHGSRPVPVLAPGAGCRR
jgi:hypothetical protein